MNLREVRDRIALVLLVVLIVLGGLARLYKLEEKSLWSDEIATIATSLGHSIDPDAFALRGQDFDPSAPVPASSYLGKATGDAVQHASMQKTVTALQANVHPLLFFVLMQGWIRMTGLDPGMLRLPAVFFGILSIPLLFWVAWLWQAGDRRPRSRSDGSNTFGTRIALLSAAWMAVSAYQIDHAQDARQYTLLIVLALIGAGLALTLKRASESSGKNPLVLWLALAVVLAAGLYTQYFFLIFVVFVFLWLAWYALRHRWENPRFLLCLLACALLSLLLFVPWLPVFQTQMAFFKNAGHYTAGLWNPIQLPEKLWRIFCEFFLPKSKIGKLIPFVIIVTALAAFFRRWRISGKPKLRWSPVLGFALIWIGAIVGGQILLDLLKDTHTATIRRYLLLASPAAYLLLSYCLVSIGWTPGRLWKGLQAGLIALMLALMLGDTAQYLFKEHHSSDEFKQAAAWINQHRQPDDLVLVNKSGAMAVGMAYYLEPETRMLGFHVTQFPDLATDAPLMRRLENGITATSRIWLTYAHAAPSTRIRLQDWLNGCGYQVIETRKFPGLQVHLLVRTNTR